PRQDLGQGAQVTYRVRFTEEAEADLIRFYEFILARDETDWALAERALEAIRNAVRNLALSPFSYRKVISGNPFLRELVIPFGATGYVALFEIDDDKTVSILAVRLQREDDYH
ncbi:MAG TPA: type II toxin-antitoxin system RelE/ParE family toxin, partial [Steroidobacteraceae bacterium]|nr:type II toxin-antitoxin system RelE/ParE family toxin [Steroidobacteraceae bacterium]HQX78761.1 type II toxin-antitoxin system RelE/ParE family toxin [Steroidobacteraceae bacterium]